MVQYEYSVFVPGACFPINRKPITDRPDCRSQESSWHQGLAEDITVTLERFPAPWVTMYLKKYPSLKMREYGFYFASPEDAEVVMEFTKPMDRGSLAKALAGIAQPEEFKLNWLNDQKAIVKLTPPAGGTKTYDLALEGAKDQDGVLVSIPGQIELRVTPDVTLRSINLATGQQTEDISVSGGYGGGVVSPDGSRAVFWELGSSVGDSADYRYWLQDLTSGDKVLLTEGGNPRVKWFPGSDRVQVGNKAFSADGRELKGPLEEKPVIGFALGLDGQIAYMSLREPRENKPNVDLVYLWDGEWKVIEGFSYQLINNNGFPLPMDPAYDPSGEKLAVVQNPAGEEQLQTTSAFILDLKTGEKALLAERALNVFWSPKGDYLAVGKVGGGINILAPTGELVMKLPSHNYLEMVGWTPDGQHLVLKKQEDNKWVTQLIEVSSGKEKKLPGMPLNIDANGLAYLMSK
ncbi:hypothetical protein SY88_20730 [Clostridiales bacterium PH28_bin88]|nr:hypothetical protein SY88_20730 [Clostridiales bacterium PH28_bin88]